MVYFRLFFSTQKKNIVSIALAEATRERERERERENERKRKRERERENVTNYFFLLVPANSNCAVTCDIPNYSSIVNIAKSLCN